MGISGWMRRRFERFDRRKNLTDRRKTKPILGFDKRGSVYQVKMSDGKTTFQKNRRGVGHGRRKTDRGYS